MTPPAPFPVVRVCGEEIRTSPTYHFDNARRTEDPSLVIQRTLDGAAFFTDRQGRRLVPAGQAMLFTHAEDSHYGYPPEATAPYHLRFLAFTPAGIRPLFEALRADFGAVVSMPEDAEATALFNEIVERYRTRRFRDRLQEADLLYRLLIALYREQVQGTQHSDPVEFGHRLLRDHFRSPLNLKQIAARCAISREHFIREFKLRYGETPGAMLRRLRLEHARATLRVTRLTVEEVALDAGFTGSNTFCRAYRHQFGLTPTAERARAEGARQSASSR
jgi:AraC-like DNA-binding protein